MPETRTAPAARTSTEVPMVSIQVTNTAGRQRSAGASRLGSVALGRVCSWPVAGAATAPIALAPSAMAFATKPATAMYVDVQNHRTRRLREPSP